MPTDLPTAIREALHADEIDATDLRQPVLRDRRDTGRRAPRALAAAAAAAVVVVVVAVVSVLSSGGHASRTPTASGSGFLLGILGYRWDASEVRDAHGQFRVPAALDAWIGFVGDKYQVLGSDSLNAISGHLAPAPGGYQVTDAGATVADYVGTDPIRQRTIVAVDAMFFTVATNPDEQPRGVQVAVRLSDNERTLTLSHGAVTLTLTRAGTLPSTLLGGSPTATAMSNSAPSRAPADTTAYPAKGCAPDPTPTVAVTIDPDTPYPMCAIVHGSQRLRVVNATNFFSRPGKTITVNFANSPERVRLDQRDANSSNSTTTAEL